jgi:ribosome maturation factor RimP
VLRVYLDKPAGAESEYVSIEECEDANRFLSEALDREDFIDGSYNLEVCSPGLDRELIRDEDYTRFAGRQVEVKTYGQIDGSKYFEGTLVGKEGDIVTIDTGRKKLEIPSDKISKINLAIVF